MKRRGSELAFWFSRQWLCSIKSINRRINSNQEANAHSWFTCIYVCIYMCLLCVCIYMSIDQKLSQQESKLQCVYTKVYAYFSHSCCLLSLHKRWSCPLQYFSKCFHLTVTVQEQQRVVVRKTIEHEFGKHSKVVDAPSFWWIFWMNKEIRSLSFSFLGEEEERKSCSNCLYPAVSEWNTDFDETTKQPTWHPRSWRAKKTCKLRKLVKIEKKSIMTGEREREMLVCCRPKSLDLLRETECLQSRHRIWIKCLLVSRLVVLSSFSCCVCTQIIILVLRKLIFWRKKSVVLIRMQSKHTQECLLREDHCLQQEKK